MFKWPKEFEIDLFRYKAKHTPRQEEFVNQTPTKDLVVYLSASFHTLHLLTFSAHSHEFGTEDRFNKALGREMNTFM